MSKSKLDFLVNFKVKGAKEIDKSKTSLVGLSGNLKGVLNSFKNIGSGALSSNRDFLTFEKSTNNLKDSIRKLNNDLRNGKKETREMGDSAERSGNSFGKMALKIGAVTLAVTAVVAGVRKLINGVSESIEVLGNLSTISDKTGVSFENLQASSALLGEMGVSINDYAGGIRRLNRLANVSDLYGVKTYANVFRDLGIDYERFAKMKPEEQFKEFAEAYNSIDEGQGRALLDRLGIRNLEQPLKNIDALNERLERLKKAGLIMSDEDGRGLGSMGDSVARLKEEWTLLYGIIASKIAPKIGEIISLFTISGDKSDITVKAAVAIGDAFVNAIDKISEFMLKSEKIFLRVLFFAKSVTDLTFNSDKKMAKVRDEYNSLVESGKDPVKDLKNQAKEHQKVIDSLNNDFDNLDSLTKRAKESGEDYLEYMVNNSSDRELAIAIEKDIKEEQKKLDKINTKLSDYEKVQRYDEIAKKIDDANKGISEKTEVVVNETSKRVISSVATLGEVLTKSYGEINTLRNKFIYDGVEDTEDALKQELELRLKQLKMVEDMYNEQSKDGGKFSNAISDDEFYQIAAEEKKAIETLKNQLKDMTDKAKREAFESSKDYIRDVEKYISMSIESPNGVLYTTKHLIDAIDDAIKEAEKSGASAGEIIELRYKKSTAIIKEALDEIHGSINKNIELEKNTTSDKEKLKLLKDRKDSYEKLILNSKKYRLSELEVLKVAGQILDVEKDIFYLQNIKPIDDELQLIKARANAGKYNKDIMDNENASLKLQKDELQKRLEIEKEIATQNGVRLEDSVKVLEVESEILYINRKIEENIKRRNDEAEKRQKDIEDKRQRELEELRRIEQEAADKKYNEEQGILDLRLRLLDVTNQDKEATKLRYDMEREEIQKTITDAERQKEALAIFDQIIQKTELQTRLIEIQDQIEEKKAQRDSESILNMERIIELQNEINQLSVEEDAIKEELNIKTKEQIEEQVLTLETLQNSLKGMYEDMTSNIAEVIKGTKSLKDAMMDFLGSTLDMMLKIAQEQLVSSLVSSSMNFFPAAPVFHTGGMVGSGNNFKGFKGLSNSEVVAVVEKGEAVLTEQQQMNVANAAKSGGQSVSNTNNIILDERSLATSVTKTSEFKNGVFDVINSNSKQINNIINS